MATPFSSGLAKWIWLPNFDDAAASGQFVLFRRTFHLDQLPSLSSSFSGPIPLSVSADTRYQLFLNGHRISLGPCKSYEGRWNYETVEDVSPFLVLGTNVLAARVLRFSSSFQGCLSMIRTPFPGVILHCQVLVS
jgi:alpha-L-rhamnosidase